MTERKAKRHRTSSPNSEIISTWIVPAVEAEERQALEAIYSKLSGEGWFKSEKWNTQSPLSEWYGVRVDAVTGRVQVLELSRNNLCGSLEDAVLDILRLTELTQLWLSENQLNGGLPSWLVERTQLTILDVGSNSLTGALSPSFANSSRLTWFDYAGGGNQLTSFYRASPPTEADAAASSESSASSASSASSTTSTTSTVTVPTNTTTSSSPITITITTPLQEQVTVSTVTVIDSIAELTLTQHAALWKVNIAKQLLSTTSCVRLITEAEKFATEHGWSKSRHRDYSTTDCDVSLCPTLLELCNQHLKQHILPTMATLFGFDTHELGVEDMFVAKYDMNGQRELMEHRDGSELSFVLVLNDEYLGGGTMFRNPKDNKSVLVRPDSVGDCVMFCGRHLHSGVQITSGVRYILTGFVRVYVDKDETKKKMLDEIVGTGKR